MKRTFTLLFILFFVPLCFQKANVAAALSGNDVLVIGIPFYKTQQLEPIKSILRNTPNVTLVYTCKQQKTFLLRYDKNQYPDFNFFVEKIHQVDSTLAVYQKVITLDEFVNQCKDETQKQ